MKVPSASPNESFSHFIWKKLSIRHHARALIMRQQTGTIEVGEA
jgi:hypothetical protein